MKEIDPTNSVSHPRQTVWATTEDICGICPSCGKVMMLDWIDTNFDYYHCNNVFCNEYMVKIATMKPRKQRSFILNSFSRYNFRMPEGGFIGCMKSIKSARKEIKGV